MPRIEIILSKKDGSVKVEVQGEKGSGCVDATKFLDELFGEADEVTQKPSYYEKATEGNLLTHGFCG